MKRLNFVLFCLLSITAIISCDKEETSEISTEENASLFYVKDDMNGMDMITDNIDHIFFIGPDSSSQGTIIKGGKMDINSDEWIKEEAFVVHIDSLNRVTSIIMDGQMCNFYNYTETTCDIAFITGDGTYECVEDVRLMPKKFISKTRSLSEEELIDGTIKVISGVKSSLELALSISSNPKSWQTAFNAFDYISGMFPDGISFGMNSASMGLKAQLMKIKPDLFSLCNVLIQAGHALSDFLTELLIGNWELKIINVEQINANMAEIVFQVSGVKENPSVELSGYVWYMNVNNKDTNNIPFEVENNTYKVKLPLNSYGSFLGHVDLNGAFGLFIRKEFKFDAFHIGIKNVTIEDNPLYEDGSVNFLLSINLEGSEDGLNDIQQFGYYTRYANAIPDYKRVEHLSSIFESTPLTYELSIDKDGFSNESINYTTFEAKPTNDYYIGAYVVLKNGNIVHLDEKEIDGLVYNRKPSFAISNIRVTDRGPYSDGDSTHDSYISYSVDYTVDGGLFVNKIYEKYGENWISSGSEFLIFNEYDDKTKYTRYWTIYYSSKYTKASPINFFAVLGDGSKYQFSQRMIFQDGSLRLNESRNTRVATSAQSSPEQYFKPLIVIK